MSHPLPQLKIASPCPVGWRTMQGNHRSRFCEQCQLHVHNVSAMTRLEVRALLQTSPDRLCLNGYVRPDGELVTLESLAELLEHHHASPERVAAVRAAVVVGMAAAALSLAACSSPAPLGGAVALPPTDAEPARPQDAPVEMPRSVGVAPAPVPPNAEMPMHAGGFTYEMYKWLHEQPAQEPR